MSQAGALSIDDADLPPDVPLIFDGNIGSASANNNVLNIIGSGGALVSASGNTITISVGGSFTWNPVTSTDNIVQIQSSNGYVCKGVSQVIFLLPLSPNFGDEFIIVSDTATFRINENGSQVMRIGAVVSTAGSGYLTSNTVGDLLQMVYVGSNKFIAFSPQGSLTLY